MNWPKRSVEQAVAKTRVRDTLGSRGYFFLTDTDGSRRSRVNEARSAERKKITREPYQTVSTVYFILGILRTDLWSQGRLESH